jgi:hypothetical protein
MKKSTLIALPLLALTLLVALTPTARAAVVDGAKGVTASLMHLCTRFCGCHHRHCGHEWCSGRQHYWCPGHR